MKNNKNYDYKMNRDYKNSPKESVRNNNRNGLFREFSINKKEFYERSKSKNSMDKNDLWCKKQSFRDSTYSNKQYSGYETSSPKGENLFKLIETNNVISNCSSQNKVSEETLKIMQNFIEKYEQQEELKLRELNLSKKDEENAYLNKQLEEIKKAKLEYEVMSEAKIKLYLEEIDNLKNTIQELKKGYIEREELFKFSLNESLSKNKEISEELARTNDRNLNLEKFSFSLSETIKKMQEEFLTFLLATGLLDKINPNDFSNFNPGK